MLKHAIFVNNQVAQEKKVCELRIVERASLNKKQ